MIHDEKLHGHKEKDPVRITRSETDSLGEMDIPADVYYGIQTARAMMNFPVSSMKERPEFIRAYAIVKKAAALTHIELEVLDSELGNAIVHAADEVMEGHFNDQFMVDVFQAGAGTSFNMNMNEVIANRALETLGKQKGDHAYLNPNDHVNMGQSTNDTFPTTCHIAVITSAYDLLNTLFDLSQAFREKAREFEGIMKSGRTHLMDAAPVSLGREFGAYAASLDRASQRITQRRNDLLELPIGGTATGSGVNTYPGYREKVVKTLSRLSGYPFIPAADSYEALQSRAQLAAFSGSLRELALELTRIANDIRLLGSGPTAGLREIRLPAVQPGSSIMPGKLNPVMAECLNMVAFQVIGNDTAVAFAAQAGQLELNVMAPLMIHNILGSISILTNFLPVFRDRCIVGITANKEKCASRLKLNPALATVLSPKIGHLEASKLAREALEKGVSVRELALSKGLITPEEAERLFPEIR